MNKRPNADSSSSTATKKTRFTEPTDDPANFADQVDSALENPSRKGKVKTDGYDSDSTDDGESVVPSRNKGLDDQLDDMFAAEPDTGEKVKRNEEKYMRLADIEGQEFGADSETSGKSDDEDDPEAIERKNKENMGFELSSFNMREELEEGKFTEDGRYVRTFDPHGVHDRWMEGLDDKEIKLARRRKRHQEKKQKELILAEEKEIEESGGKPAMEQQILRMLKRGETVLEALQRLGSRSKNIHSSKRIKRGNGMEVDKPTSNIPSDIEHITHLASNLMSLGDADIYSKTYEELLRNVRASGMVGDSWVAPSADLKYEYKWRSQESGQTEEIFGPYGEDDIKSWFNASYFGTLGEKIKVRESGGTWGDWADVVQ